MNSLQAFDHQGVSFSLLAEAGVELKYTLLNCESLVSRVRDLLQDLEFHDTMIGELKLKFSPISVDFLLQNDKESLGLQSKYVAMRFDDQIVKLKNMRPRKLSMLRKILKV